MKTNGHVCKFLEGINAFMVLLVLWAINFYRCIDHFRQEYTVFRNIFVINMVLNIKDTH